MALFRIGPSPVSNANVPATTPLAAIAQLAPAHMVSSMAIFQRIYVGSIQFDISDADLTLLFSQFGPVRSVSMMQDPVNRRHRGYGFIEFETAEAAALAQEQMEGAELGGRAIRVGRPNNFPADLPPGVPRPVEGRIYVANVHEMVKEEELRMVVEAFGRVRCCHLVPDEKTGKHRGYAYIEYEDEGCANSAIFSLNNFELAKRLLKVGRTISGGPIPHGMESLKTTVIPPLNSKVPTAVLRAAQQINSGNSSASGGSINSTSPLETSVMILRNLEDYSTIAEDPEAIPELEVDVLEECSKFGPVVCCRVHLEHKDKTVTIFVKFSTAAILEEAIRVMHLRWFGGRQIIAEPYDEQRFQTEYGNHKIHPYIPSLDPLCTLARPWAVYKYTTEMPASIEDLFERISQVYKARCRKTGELVALKKIRMESEKEGFPVTAAREIKLLKSMSHPNIVKLKSICASSSEAVFLVFEYLEFDLAGLLPTGLTLAQVKYILQGILQALHYLHSHGVLHRDLKGSNVLVGRDGSIKLADFGLAKCMHHPDLRSTRMLTNRVVTLWYRPPEVLLGATSYGPSVDMWGVGCILLELIAGRAVFTGQDELTQLRAICERCGPVVGGWPWLRLMGEMPSPGISLESEFGAKLGEIGMNLVHGLLAMDPEQRIDTETALRHPWFQEEPLPCHSTELISPTIEGDWHEFEFKQRKRNVK